MTEIDRNKLRALAMAATPGEWRCFASDPAEGVNCWWINAQPNPAMRGFTKEIAACPGTYTADKGEPDAAYIAAANPKNMLALLDQIDGLEKALVKDASYVATIEDRNASSIRLLREAVNVYGKPGGPWNVPSDPGSWIEKAREALESKP